MHELSITQQILEIALNKAQEADAKSIRRINLVIGDLSSVVEDCVRFYFDLLSRDSIARGAELCFRRVPLTVKCRLCSGSFSPTGEDWTCPQCHQWSTEIISGDEFYMDSLEVE